MTPPAQLAALLDIVTVVAPVGVYFLILGLLNTRRCPQLLSARRDTAILLLALSPLLGVPLVRYGMLSPLGGSAGLAALLAVGAVLAGRGHKWVIYNIPAGRARQAVARALDRADIAHQPDRNTFHLPRGGAVVLSVFPLLRNVSVRWTGGNEADARRFADELATLLDHVPAETSPMAVSLLLVATGMLVAPLALLAGRAPELVRLLTHLLP